VGFSRHLYLRVGKLLDVGSNLLGNPVPALGGRQLAPLLGLHLATLGLLGEDLLGLVADLLVHLGPGVLHVLRGDIALDVLGEVGLVALLVVLLHDLHVLLNVAGEDVLAN
jgi:hypothetical protein